MMIRTACLSGLLSFLSGAPAVAQEIRFRLPVACEIGRSCEVQHYVDHDPTGGSKDYRCGTLTYDGHDGTDFRVPDLAVQRAGVDVLAAAPGRVLRVRDAVADISVRELGRERVEGTECGNGLVIAHEAGFETQYCHLAKGSVAVRPGDTVEAGQRLGKVGMSGLAEFPHLHLTIRRGGAVVDPFQPAPAPGACGSDVALWDEASREALAYRAGAVLNAGFASGPVTMEAIEAGEAGRSLPGGDAPALVAYIRAIGLRAGDVQVLALAGPDGAVLAENRAKPLDRDKAQWMMFSGVKRPAAGWRPGAYRATYQVLRAGRAAIEKVFDLDLKP